MRAQLPSGHTYIGHLSAGESKAFSTSLFPGEQGRLSIVPDHLKEAGRPGKYRVIFVLKRPGRAYADENSLDFSLNDEGDSHLAITPPAFVHPTVPGVISVNLESGVAEFKLKFAGRPNAKGFLGRIESPSFDAASFEDAESKAYHLLVRALSNLAGELDIPLYVHQIFVVEEQTGAMSLRLSVATQETPLSVSAVPQIGPEFSYYMGLYREALNSNSPVYRYLCFFKIIEGIRSRRERIIRETLASGQRPVRRLEKFPSDSVHLKDWLRSIYSREWEDLALSQILRREAVGKKFGYVIDTFLIPLRNRVAHAILDSGEPGISSDDLMELEKVIYWLPATRVVVRRMVRNEFPQEFLTHLPATGDLEIKA